MLLSRSAKLPGHWETLPDGSAAAASGWTMARDGCAGLTDDGAAVQSRFAAIE
jgi:hypothetical protein